MIKKYRKKPVVIEALQWNGKNTEEVKEFIGDNFVHVMRNTLFINTLEGIMEASINDYIIKGIQNEFYPCKPDIFLDTYDEVEE